MHNHEIRSLVHELKARQARLQGSRCLLGCSDCEPCRKSFSSPPDCEWLHNDIKDGNRSRWKAWRELETATKAYQAALIQFGRERDLNLATEGFSTTLDMIGAVLSPNKLSIATAAISVGQYLYKLYNYNGAYAADLKRHMAPFAARANKASNNAKYLDEIFWKQVDAYKRTGCNNLSASDFNRT